MTLLALYLYYVSPGLLANSITDFALRLKFEKVDILSSGAYTFYSPV
jgi:hypothetical protein